MSGINGTAGETGGSALPRADARPGSGRLPSLDGLRGIAILLVLILHYSQSIGQQSGALGVFLKLCNLGALGVDLFFVLSGFLITGILLETRSQAHYFRNFYVRRSLRIFPLYYGVLAVAIWVLPRFIVTDPQGLDLAVQNQGWLWLYGTNFALAYGVKLPWYFDHFWSLAIEEHFYLAWPLIVWCCRPRVLLVVCVVLAAAQIVLRAIAASHDQTNLFFITPLRIDGLLMGAMLAIIGVGHVSTGRLLPLAWTLTILLSGALVVPYLLVSGSGNALLGVIRPALTALLFAGALIIAVNSREQAITSRILRTYVLQFLGKYSYGLYVFHYLIFAFLQMHALPWISDKMGGRPVLVLATFTAINLAIALPVAVASFHLFEVHWLRLKRYFGGIRSADRDLHQTPARPAPRAA